MAKNSRSVKTPGRRSEAKPGRKPASGGQPDFGCGFHLHEPRRIRYEVRHGENLLHDLIYMSSYIHDAKTSLSSVRFRGGRLNIGMERDRWELFRHSGELDCVPARLDISGVLSVGWRFEHRALMDVAADPHSPLWISGCRFPDPDAYQPERAQLIISGGGGFWSLSAVLSPREWKIVLRDI